MTPLETAPIIPDFGSVQTDRKLAIICSKGNLDMAYPGLILANAALGDLGAADRSRRQLQRPQRLDEAGVERDGRVLAAERRDLGDGQHVEQQDAVPRADAGHGLPGNDGADAGLHGLGGGLEVQRQLGVVRTIFKHQNM